VLPLTLPESICPDGGEASRTYKVNATDAKHVQIALQFASEHNLKVNVNNTGHAGPVTQRYDICLVLSACSSLTYVLQECILWRFVVSYGKLTILKLEAYYTSIHTHYMKGLEFYQEYTPQSCPRNITHMAATLGAGEQGDDVFQAIAKYNAVTVGGTYAVSVERRLTTVLVTLRNSMTNPVVDRWDSRLGNLWRPRMADKLLWPGR
jgi:hypothetical protein